MTKKLALALAITTLSIIGARASEDWVRFSQDGSQILVEAPGVSKMQGATHAVFSMDGKYNYVISKDSMVGPIKQSTASTPFGEAAVSTATYGIKNSPFQYTVTLKRLKKIRAFTLQGVFHNRSDKNVKLEAFDLLNTLKSAGGNLAVENASDWLVTPLMQDNEAEDLSKTKKTFRDAVIVYHKNGQGFLVGPVGPAEAYTSVEFANGEFNSRSEMEGVVVAAGQDRRSEEVVYCFEPTTTATHIWTRWVAITHKARTKSGPVYGWCSWYDRTTKIDEAHILNVADILAKNPNVFGKGILQIDDGYQKMDGDWSANTKFPSGLAAVTKKIRNVGWTPGVWFAPLMMNPEHPWMKAHPDAIQTNALGIKNFMNANWFHPDGANWLVPDHPETKKFLKNIIKSSRDNGFGYIKIDFNGIGNRFYDPTKTSLQIFRELYTLYRKAAGDKMYILSCLGQPTRGVIGFIDAARVGPDSHPAHFEKCLKSVLRFQIYDNVWWQNDPDVSYLATGLPSRVLGPTPQGEEMWKTWHAVTTLVGGTAMNSEPLQAEDCRAAWRQAEVMRPASAEPARLLTLGRSPQNTIFGFAAARPYGDFAVYNLYNDSPGTKSLPLNFKDAGLPAGVNCAVFDYWQNKVIGYAKDSYATAPLKYYASALLRFTPLKGDAPILVGSNLHLSIGATEVRDIRVKADALEIKLTDAGAQDGNLTFFSKKPLEAKGAKNCKIVSVESAGENLWKVNLSGRQWGKSQSVSLVIK